MIFFAAQTHAQTCAPTEKSDYEIPAITAEVLHVSIPDGMVTLSHPSVAEIGLASGVDSFLVSDDSFLTQIKPKTKISAQLIRRKNRLILVEFKKCEPE